MSHTSNSTLTGSKSSGLARFPSLAPPQHEKTLSSAQARFLAAVPTFSRTLHPPSAADKLSAGGGSLECEPTVTLSFASQPLSKQNSALLGENAGLKREILSLKVEREELRNVFKRLKVEA